MLEGRRAREREGSSARIISWIGSDGLMVRMLWSGILTWHWACCCFCCGCGRGSCKVVGAETGEADWTCLHIVGGYLVRDDECLCCLLQRRAHLSRLRRPILCAIYGRLRSAEEILDYSKTWIWARPAGCLLLLLATLFCHGSCTSQGLWRVSRGEPTGRLGKVSPKCGGGIGILRDCAIVRTY